MTPKTVSGSNTLERVNCVNYVGRSVSYKVYCVINNIINKFMNICDVIHTELRNKARISTHKM